MTYTPRSPSKRFYKIDFTAQTTQNLKPDGTFTIDGKSWTSENTTSATTFSLTNGTGLQIVSTGGTNTKYQDNTRTAPLIRSAVTGSGSQFITPYQLSKIRGFRVMFRVSTNAAQNTQAIMVGMEYTFGAALLHAVNSITFSTSQKIIGQVAASTTSTFDSGLAVGSNDVLAVTLSNPFQPDFDYGVFSGGNFPSSLTTQSTWAGVSPDTTLNGNFEVDWRIVIAAPTNGAAGNFTSTITHMQIDQLLYN